MVSNNKKMAHAVCMITVATFLARILGYVRDALINYQFGQTRTTDIYNAAFSIPDFIYNIFVGGALTAAFIPIFSSYLAHGKDDEAWHVASSLFDIMISVMLLAIGLGVLFTPQLVHQLVPGFNSDETQKTVMLTRIMFVQTFFMALSGLSMGVLNSYKNFKGPALGSILYNLSILLVGFFFGPRIGITAFALGVVSGAIVNFVVHVPPLVKIGLRYHLVFDFNHPGVKQFGLLFFPVMIGLAISQFNLFLGQNLASGLSPGELSAFRLAQRVVQIPLGIFAVAIGTAIFPNLTEQSAKGESNAFRRTASLGIRVTNFTTIPCAVALMAFGLPIIRVLFQNGQFSAASTQVTATALFYFSFGIVGYSAVLVLTRICYALRDTISPVIVSIFTIYLNMRLNVLLFKLMGLSGLAMAWSIVGIINMIALLIILRLKLGHIDGRQMVLSGSGSVLDALAMGIVCYALINQLQGVLGITSKISQCLSVAITAAAAVIIYLTLAYLLRLEEFRMGIRLMGQRNVIPNNEAQRDNIS